MDQNIIIPKQGHIGEAMFNYYINEELVEEYPKGNPREFKFGETHYIEVIDDVEDESTKVLNDKVLPSDYENYDYKAIRITQYPTIEDQLDMLFWDQKNNTNIWQETIQKVKDFAPKIVEQSDEVSEPQPVEP